jgi:hypothetical protein
MSKKRILAVGLELASSDAEHASFQSKMSLLDWDIVLFKPDISDFMSYGDYKGKPSLSESSSFQLKECCEHWRREIKQAVEAGKTVIVYLSELKTVYVDTGKRSYSGTGRNQKTTQIVAEYDNFKSIPPMLTPVIATGNSMKLVARTAEVMAPYWSEFENYSQYRVQLTEQDVPACIITSTGEKVVGALYRCKSSAGTLLLLPDIDFYPANFTIEHEGEENWTTDASKFAGRMLAAVVALDKSLRSSGELTPEPTWAAEPEFSLGIEYTLRVQLLDAEREVEKAQRYKEDLEDKLRSAGSLRALLYEKGKPLENAIIDALRMLGFNAHQFKETDSEFDVVFESQEGRLIGEAEGKDSKAVNIDKLRQLAMNIHEDLQREDVTKPAKPVLFGNAFRLMKLCDRADPFTEKCVSAAETSSTALVFTPDLFQLVQYLTAEADSEFAMACREAMLTTTGRVSFPPTPGVEESFEPMQTETAK